MPKPPRPRPQTRRKLPKADVEAIFDALGAANPSPKTELNYSNPYTLLVAVVLSAQATDVGVNRATAKLFEQVQTPQQMLDLGLDGLKSHIRTIGLFNSKAANVIRLSEQLIGLHGGQVPRTEKELVALAIHSLSERNTSRYWLNSTTLFTSLMFMPTACRLLI